VAILGEKKRKRQKEEKSTTGSIVEFFVIIAVALGLAIGIQAFLVKPFRIPSPSMVPTLEVGQRVLVNRIGTHFGDPDRGDVVVFKPPQGANTGRCGVEKTNLQACPQPTKEQAKENFIKRVVGLPGDELFVKNNRVYIDGKALDEPYVNKADSTCDRLCNLEEPITVPPGHFFMMGDNRGASDDSRQWGPVPEDWIIGDAFFTYWPPNRIGTL
jgi:signal peptidase I